MRKLLLLLPVLGCVIMGALLYRDYQAYSPNVFRDITPVIRGTTSALMDSYYENFGPFRPEDPSQTEVNALARYTEAKICYDAFSAAGATEKSEKYARIMEETLPVISEETRAYLSRYHFYRMP